MLTPCKNKHLLQQVDSRPEASSGRIMFERDEMRTCPHCDTVMEEKAGSGGEMLKIPQQLADDQPPPMKVNRVRWSCPKCSHVEEGLPVAHGAWDKSDPPHP
jgi:hypothetical protein